jgi:hypothetical protein
MARSQGFKAIKSPESLVGAHFVGKAVAVEREESLCAGTGKSLGNYARVSKGAITGL